MEHRNSTKNSQASPINEAVAPYHAGQSSALDLEFPDWSGQDRPAPTATVEDIHRLSLSLLGRNPLPQDFDERRLKRKVSVEFIL
jgi:hypothetical protein